MSVSHTIIIICYFCTACSVHTLVSLCKTLSRLLIGIFGSRHSAEYLIELDEQCKGDCRPSDNLVWWVRLSEPAEK